MTRPSGLAVPLTIVGTPITNSGTSVTLPTHAVGQLIVICAFSSATTVGSPSAGGTVPAWSAIDSSTSIKTSYFVASATNHTSGTWNNAVNVTAVVLSGQNASPIGGHAISSGGGANPSAPSITLSNTTGSSELLYFYGGTSGPGSGAWDAAPAGYTRLVDVAVNLGICACLNSKDDSTSDGSQVQGTMRAASTNRTATIEILAA